MTKCDIFYDVYGKKMCQVKAKENLPQLVSSQEQQTCLNKTRNFPYPNRYKETKQCEQGQTRTF